MNKLHTRKAAAIALAFSVFIHTNVFAEATLSDSALNRDFVELSPKDIKPPFTQKTVMKLNAIVRRSFEAINEFDLILDASRDGEARDNGAAKSAQQRLTMVSALQKTSQSARIDMDSAVAELRDSDEDYNRAILEGMIEFVEEVEKEISKESLQLKKSLKSAD